MYWIKNSNRYFKETQWATRKYRKIIHWSQENNNKVRNLRKRSHGGKKKNQTEIPGLKNATNKTSNCDRVHQYQNRSSQNKEFEAEDRNFDIIQSLGSKGENMKKNEECLYDIWNTSKRSKLQIIEVPDGKGERKLT